MDDLDALVIGAGPTGLAVAIALCQQGIRAGVIDKAPSTKRQARAAIVWQRELEVLRDLGAAARFLDEGRSLQRANVYYGDRELGDLDMGRLNTEFPQPLMIEQDRIEALLAERLHEVGVAVQWHTTAVRVRVGDDGAQVDVSDADGRTRTIAARWLVGCEGAHSLVRESVDIPFDGRPRENLEVVQINAEVSWRYRQHPHRGYFFLRPAASLGVFPRPGGGYRFFCFLSGELGDGEAQPSVEEMRDLIADITQDPQLELRPTEPLWINRARFQDRMARRLRFGCALLVGDSAHVWAPIGGHGLNTALRGAHNLAWKLAGVHRGELPATMLDTYDQEQRHSAQVVMKEMQRNVLESPPGLWTLFGLNILMPLALASDLVERRIEDTLSDLNLNYRNSPLAVDKLGTKVVQAGDRMPDLPVIARGRRRHIHEYLSYERWTLLAFTDDEDDLGPLDQAVGPRRTRVATTRLELLPDLREDVLARSFVLVRPDGHVGLAAPMSAPDALDEYLTEWMPLARRGVDRP